MRLTDKILRDWYIDGLVEKGVNVEYWDIVSIVREEHNDHGMVAPAFLHIIRTFGELEAKLCLQENRDAYFVMLISEGGCYTKTYRLLSRNNCRMLSIAQGAMPSPDKFTEEKILNYLSHPFKLLRRLIDFSKTIFYKKTNLIKPFDIIFAAGNSIMKNVTYSSRIVPINMCDYDQYINERFASGLMEKGRYAVFLDINAVFQSDLKISNLPSLNPSDYFSSLNRFFGLLEREYRIDVVIAAHPTSNYNNEIFQGRKIYRLKTPTLVRDAEFVITHHSTSLSYAVLNIKPVIFIYTNEMLTLYKETVIRHINAQADYLKSKVYNVDEIIHGNQVAIKDIDILRYDEYKYSFLTTHESEFLTTQEIIYKEILAI